PDLQATMFAIQTQVGGPLPSPPVAPELDDGSLDAADVTEARQTRARKSQPFQTLAIGDIRNLPDDTPVITTGVVTMPTGLWDAARAYIQANGAGILIHGFGATALHLGDSLTIKGRVHHLHGEVEVAAVKNGEQVSPGGALPAPRPIAPAAVGGGTEALLVRVAGRVTRVERDYATIADAAGSTRLYVYSRLGLPAGSLKAEDTVSVTGVVNAAESTSAGDAGGRTYAQRVLTATHRLVPRLSGDVLVGGVPLGPTPVGSEPGSPRAEPSAAGRPGPAGAATGSGSAQPAAATLPAATPAAFVTPVLSSRQAATQPTTPASNVLLLHRESSEGPPVWMWVCVGLGVALILGGAAVG
ncbi:MAG TPA: OB-fold nucleic acid binding domain-containing protein, partial [Chloroflexota bacterium]